MLKVNSCFIRMPVDSWCQRSKQSKHAKLNSEAGRSVGLYSGLCCKKECLVTLFAGFYNLATRKHEACDVRTRVSWLSRCNKIFPPCDHDFSPGANNVASIWIMALSHPHSSSTLPSKGWKLRPWNKNLRVHSKYQLDIR